METSNTPERADDEPEIERAAAQVGDHLAQRGVTVRDGDTPDERADLLSAVEDFERAVAARGGDSYTNSPLSSDPDRREFVVPRRSDDEGVPGYIARIREAADRLRPPAP